jgi:PKD repeat protein
MVIRCTYRAGRWACEPPTVPAPPQAGRLRRPLLHALMLTTMLVVAASLAALPACAYVGDLHNVRTGSDYMMSPDVAYDWSTDEYLVVWQDDYLNHGTDMDVWARPFYADGTPVAAAFHPAFSTTWEDSPKVASVGASSWLVAWVKHSGTGDEVHGMTVSSTGVTGADNVYYTATAGQTIPSLDVGGTTYGWYLIVFDVENSTGDGDIRSALVAGDGSLYWVDAVSVHASWDDYDAAVDQIGMDFLVAWTWYNSGDGSTSILARQVSGWDGSMPPEFAVHADGMTSGAPSVASDADSPEQFLVTYADEWSWPDYDIGYAFVSGGAVVGSGAFGPTYTDAFQYYSSASFTGLADTFFITWAEATDLFSQRDVLGSYLETDGSSGPREYLAADSGVSEDSPQSTRLWTSLGNIAAVWDQWLMDPGAWDTNIYERDWWLLTAELHDDGADYQYFGPTSVVPGTPWEAGCDVRNDGDLASGPFTVFIYASTDTTLDMGDYFVGWVPMADIAAGDYADCDWSGSFPGVPAGIYWIFWYIDAWDDVPETNESDNSAYLSGYQLTVGEAVNLRDDGAPYQSFSPTTVAPGDTLSVSCDVRNAGNVASGPFAVQVYASADTTIDTSDYLIGEVAMADLAANDWADCDWSGPFPETVPGGTYWVGWVIDPADAVAEGNEDDNATYLSAYQLSVEAPAMAQFSGAPTTGEPGLVVAFTDESAGTVDSWAWDFGDPASGGSNASDEQNPSHTYAAEGSYDVSLTVTNAFGTDTESKAGYILVVTPVGAAFSASPAAGIVPLAVTFTDLTTGDPTAWAWDFGDGASSTQQNPSHTYGDPGYYTVSLTASKDLSEDVEEQPGCIAAGFVDTAPDFWAFHYILACATADMVQGYYGNQYKPAEPVTRGQMAVYIARALAGGDEAVPDPSDTPTFADVPADHWAYRYVEYVASLDVVQGYGGGTYKPDIVVNRGQMAVFIARSVVDPPGDAGVPEASPSDPAFPDVTATNDWGWCYKYVQYIATLDPLVVQGYPDGLYHPERQVTRDQMAVYVQRAFDLPMYMPSP